MRIFASACPDTRSHLGTPATAALHRQKSRWKTRLSVVQSPCVNRQAGNPEVSQAMKETPSNWTTRWSRQWYVWRRRGVTGTCSWSSLYGTSWRAIQTAWHHRHPCPWVKSWESPQLEPWTSCELASHLRHKAWTERLYRHRWSYQTYTDDAGTWTYNAWIAKAQPLQSVP